ncbi:GlxA family transcriptional regulator [Acidisoma sp. S159]|jgi:transcriptional regulator GlxA family with amidase domain|uniref:GlxA family transcriptional regulator n=1 Tax=Acidisoma sp. S159 TaxID=1747225 RepID=UPI00131E37BF|nr:GlxA family transcriptional regulator [Acidisoma sp. S159]
MPIYPRIQPKLPRLIELLAFPEVQILDVTGPLQVFATANDIAGGKILPYAIHVVSQAGGAVTSSSGVGLLADALPPHDSTLDTLIIAGGPGIEAAAADEALVDWVRGRAGQARRFASVCTGAILLAMSGLLDGRRAATHWSLCAELAKRFPLVRVQPDPIFVHDGPAWTSAGVTAGIDLALALVEEDLGRTIALAVARYLVVFLKRPGGQAQFSAALALQDEGRFDALHSWIGAHLSGDLSLPMLADQAGMSARSFSRHYLEATGRTPARAVETLRVEAAQGLLLDSQLPVKRVARRCGFGSEETMRRSFLRLLAATPQEYRARFGS